MVVTNEAQPIVAKPVRKRKTVAKTEGGDGVAITTKGGDSKAMAAKGGDGRAITTKGGDFNDVMDGIKKTASTVGDVVKTAASVAPYVLPLVGLGKEGKPKITVAHLSEWNAFVKKTREETGKSLKDTLKYIKENNLYKKRGTEPAKKPTVKRPRKTKEGGSSGGILINERAEAQLKGDVSAEPRVNASVPSMKVPRTRAKKIVAIKEKSNLVI